MRDRNTLYFHFANLGLVLVGLFSVQAIFHPFVFIIVLPGTIAGFFVSWYLKEKRPDHMDTFIGMLSLAAVVIILSRVYDNAITFENLLRGFSITLVWLMLFQSFGLRTGKSYALIQFITACLLISSVAIALEDEMFYIILLAAYLFIFIFSMRLSLVCEQKRKGSKIIGDETDVMSLPQQIKVGAFMFALVLLVASFVYPLVPRFESISFSWIPSTLLGIPERVPLLKMFKQAPLTVKDNDKMKKEQPIMDEKIKKRENKESEEPRSEEKDIEAKEKKDQEKEQEKEQKKEQISKRFPSEKFNKEIDVVKVEFLTIRSDANEIPLDKSTNLHAELTLSDESTIPATPLVDWKVKGTAEINITQEGELTAKSEGEVTISATYLGTFSNDIKIKIIPPIIPKKKKTWQYYSFMIVLWLLILVALGLFIWIFNRSRYLSELAVKNPRKFIKEIYAALCRGFRFYGVPRAYYMAYREFFKSVKNIVSLKPESMRILTERQLEASFSTHKISVEHSRRTLESFHGVKDAVLARDARKEAWKKFLFRVFLLDVLMMPREIKAS